VLSESEHHLAVRKPGTFVEGQKREEGRSA